MIVFPNCKINLGLDIIRKRDDGYHELETVFYPLPFYDVLEIVAVDPNEFSYSTTAFTLTGLPIEGENESNLCTKAYELLKKDNPGIGAIKIHLHKIIPAGAGLGGGSADASFTLQLLNKMYDLKLTEEQLMEYAVQLGSDCPFFILNKPCIAGGRGEKLKPIQIDFSLYKFILINPVIHIHTGNAFGQATPAHPADRIEQIIQRPVTTWKSALKNDFESTVFKQFPEIKKIKDELYEAGAVYASMSGSGSTVYGIFAKDIKLNLVFPPHYFIRELMNV